MGINAKQMKDENGNPFYPITHISLVRDDQGRTIEDFVDSAIITENTVEDGVFFVDKDLNIGVFIDSSGVHSRSILNYQIIED